VVPEWEYRDGWVWVRVPEVEIHTAVAMI